MSGGWIKMGVGLRRHPKVVRMASATRADKLRVVGALHAVWCVFDEHSPDGVMEGYTLASMDEEIGWKGFSAAMQAVGWLIVTDDGLEAPDYEEHNGASAKRRAAETARKAESREKSGDVRTKAQRIADNQQTQGGQMSASSADTKRARVEEIREEEKEKGDPPAARVPRTTRKCPESFAVTPELTAWAAKEAPDVALAHETAKLRDHTFKNAISDWPGAWRNWMRRAQTDVKPAANSETSYARSMREKYEQVAPSIAAKKPGSAIAINPMEVLDGIARIAG